jgi:hypothetical protein
MSHGILRYILGYYTKQYPQDIEFIHNQYYNTAINGEGIKSADVNIYILI